MLRKGLFGRNAGSVEGLGYSGAMKQEEIENILVCLEETTKQIPSTFHAFPALT
jgi:cytochrome c2